MHLEVAILEANKLPSPGVLKRAPDIVAQLKLNGLDDPQTVVTPVMKRTLAPKWDMDNEFAFSIPDQLQGLVVLDIVLMDNESQTVVASTSIPIHALLRNEDSSGKSTSWYELRNEGRGAGKVLLSAGMRWEDEAADSSEDGESFSEQQSHSPTPEESSHGTQGSSLCKTRYRLGDVVGKGAFGKVFLGMNVSTGELLAVKQIEMIKLTSSEVAAIEQELHVLRELRHPNIVAYIDTDVIDKALHILMEYCPGGSLAKLLRMFGAFEEETIKVYTIQILQGIVFLHDNKIVHRDIKGANIFVAHQGIKIGDFGASTMLLGASTIIDDIQGVQGTPYWMSPEVILQKTYGRKTDVWSLGMTIIEMATGTHPWGKNMNKFTVMYEIANGSTLPSVPDHISTECKTFIETCLQRNPEERPTSAELQAHPFITS